MVQSSPVLGEKLVLESLGRSKTRLDNFFAAPRRSRSDSYSDHDGLEQLLVCPSRLESLWAPLGAPKWPHFGLKMKSEDASKESLLYSLTKRRCSVIFHRCSHLATQSSYHSAEAESTANYNGFAYICLCCFFMSSMLSYSRTIN